MVYELFQYIGVKSMVFFSICKRFNGLRETVLTMHCLSKGPNRFISSIMIDKNARMDLRILLKLYQWPKLESGGRYNRFKKIVLKFIENKRRKEMFYLCRTSYLRRLVHLFCDAQDLEHKTIDTGRVKHCCSCEYSYVLRGRTYLRCVNQKHTEIGIMITKKVCLFV